ncbi:hemerythrin domain-containing protein [Sphingosinithalassobacter portus]|uniref:hemerythrin domain-containing protein n=1 Tax=Stakelama portus TaxID=2676234 RepID=UPI000D6E3AD1|nr:hemerythrin domain-containing protein [Sphingosinithalassobacter portus]
MPDRQHSRYLIEHAMIDRCAKDLARLADQGAPPRRLADALALLARTVADHLKREDALIYELAMRARPGIASGSIDRVKRDFETLKDNWVSYIDRWSEGAIAADRDSFAVETQAMLPRLHERVKLESDLLVAMSLQEGGESAAVNRA